MNMYSYNCSHNLMIHMHRKFNDDIFARCLVFMKNVIISFIKEYRGPTLRSPCDVINDVNIMKILFWHNLGRSVHIWGQIEAVFNISQFLKWPLFWVRALAQILTEIYHFQNFTHFLTWWHHRWRHECLKHNLHNSTSPTMYLQNIVCVAPVLHR